MKQQLVAKVGMFCQSKAGRDKDAIYIIIKLDGDFVFVVDGDYKKIEKPKKKRLKHIKLIDSISEAIEKNLKTGKVIHDSQVSSAIKKIMEASKNG